jgi:hypothetical protein
MTFNRCRNWTEEDRRLLELRDAGRSHLSIAAALKGTKAAVHTRVSKLRADAEDQPLAD